MDELEDYCVEAPENAFPAFEEGVSYQKIVAVILRNPKKESRLLKRGSFSNYSTGTTEELYVVLMYSLIASLLRTSIKALMPSFSSLPSFTTRTFA